MKFKIDNEGYLKIQRGSVMCRVGCPIDASPVDCGSWCALFSEPETMLDHEAKPYIRLELCGKTLILKTEDFEDER